MADQDRNFELSPQQRNFRRSGSFTNFNFQQPNYNNTGHVHTQPEQLKRSLLNFQTNPVLLDDQKHMPSQQPSQFQLQPKLSLQPQQQQYGAFQQPQQQVVRMVQQDDSRIKSLQIELDNLTKRLNNTLGEKEQYANMLMQKDAQIRDLDARLADSYGKFQQNEMVTRTGHQEKQFLESELLRLQDILIYKDKEINDLRVQSAEAMSNAEQVRRLSQILTLRDQDIDEWRQKYANLELALADSKTRETKYGELENRLSIQNGENERLNGLIRMRNNDLDHSQQNVKALELQINKLRDIDIQNQNLNNILQQKDKEIHDLKVYSAQQESRIRDLVKFEQRFNDDQIQIQMLQKEIERLNEITRMQLQEINATKNTLHSVDAENQNEKVRHEQTKKATKVQKQNHDGEVDRLNQLLQLKEHETQELHNRYQKLQQVVTDLRQYEQKSKQLEDKCESMHEQITDLTFTLQNVDKQCKQLKPFELKSRELENRVTLLTQEIERLNTQDAQRVKNIKDLETQVYQLRPYEVQCRELENKIDQLHKDLNDWRNRYDQMNNLVLELRTYEKKYHEFDDRNALLSGEIERLNNVLRQKVDDIEALKATCQKIEQKNQDLLSFESQCRLLQSNLQKSQADNESLRSQTHDLNEQITNLRLYQSKCTDLENRQNLLTQEINRLNTVLKTKIDELEDLKNKISYLESFQYKNQELQRVIDHLNEEINSSRTRYGQLEHDVQEVSIMKSQLKDKDARTALLSNEIERLNSVLRQKIDEIKDLKSNMAQLSIKNEDVYLLESKVKSHDQLQNQLANKHQELDETQRKLVQTQMERDDLAQRQEQAKRSVHQQRDQHTGELSRMTDLLQNKMSELEEWKQKYYSLEHGNLRGSSTQLQDYENKNRLLMNEIDRLNQVLRVKLNEIEDLRRRLDDRDLVGKGYGGNDYEPTSNRKSNLYPQY